MLACAELTPTAADSPTDPIPNPFPFAQVILSVPLDALFEPIPAVPPIAVPVMFNCPVLALFAPYAVAVLPPVAVPIIFNIPVLELFAPYAVALLPPVALPVMVVVPAAFCTPIAPVALPPVAFPVILTIPVLVLFTALQLPALPPKRFPVIFKVPVELLTAPLALVTDPAVMFPTMFDVAGDAAEKLKQLTELLNPLCVTFAVNVTPLFKTYVPVPAFESSVQVTFAVIVIVCPVEARASSPAPGTMPPTHVAPALKFPVAAERISAIA
jgi:hypothetical protein